MSDTKEDVILPPGIWTDLYAVSGITVGSAIDIYNKGSHRADIAIKATSPTGVIGVPLHTGSTGSYLGISAGESGAWARSEGGTRLSVQEG